MDKRMKKAIVAGHICLDITPMFPDKGKSAVQDVLLPGKLLQMKGVDVHTGGAVANTGLAMKLLGNDVWLMGKIGNDAFGKIVLDILKQYGAEQGMIVSEQSSTSYSVVLAVPGNDRIFLHDPGANNTFCGEDLDWEEIAGANLFHFGYPPIMRRMYQNSGEELYHILKRVKSLGCAVSLDMAAVDPASEAGQEDWKRLLEKVLPYVDFFVPSVEELCFMLDRPQYDAWNKKAAGRDITEIIQLKDIAALGEQVLAMGAKVSLIKCGAAGIYYRSAETGKLGELCENLSLKPEEWADRQGLEKSYMPEKICSGTGAGDTSIAAFLTSVLNGASMEEALQMAAATGACCVEAYDALSGLRPLTELKERIADGWKKQNIILREGNDYVSDNE